MVRYSSSEFESLNQGKIGVAFSYFLGMHGVRCVSLPTAVFFTRSSESRLQCVGIIVRAETYKIRESHS